MLRIVEQAVPPRSRPAAQGNEDNYFVRAPLFVVADGMGGAQAGEVASEMAVESFDAGLPATAARGAPARSIEEANRRIHERSPRDESAPRAWARRSPPPMSASARSRSATSATRAPTCCATAR